ncbi:phospholipid carrier-dependent glycosyltransferase [Magnetococcales bacterium HHB-1]
MKLFNQLSGTHASGDVQNAAWHQSTFFILAGVMTLFSLLALTKVFMDAPWVDEAWFSNPLYDWFTTGSFGITTYTPEGTSYLRIDQISQWQPPFYFFAQGLIYSLFDVGVIQMRILSLLCGLLAIAALFLFTKEISGRRDVAMIAALILAVDTHFISASSTGRMDIMSVSFGLAGLALFLTLRKHRFSSAIFWSHFCVMVSGLSHANGILYLLLLVPTQLLLDHQRLNWRLILWGATPYFIGLLLWLPLILSDLEAFYHQFIRGQVMRDLNPGFLQSLIAEIKERYLPAYGWSDHVSSWLTRSKIIVLFFYLGSWILTAIQWRRKAITPQQAGFMVGLPLFVFLIMAGLFGNKSISYIIHIIPFFILSVAWIAVTGWQKGGKTRLFTIAAISLLISMQSISVMRRAIIDQSYATIYNPTVTAIQQALKKTTTPHIFASAEFAFGLSFETVIDDIRLGFLTGKTAEIIVMEKRYWDFYHEIKKSNPPLAEHIRSTLEEQYHLVYRNRYYSVYTKQK